jgi:peptidyl-prolyl cis-trans isomerase SurA
MRFMMTVLLTSASVAHSQIAAPMTPATQAAPAEQGQTIDRVIAIVNGDLILESDVDEERRFATFQPFSTTTDGTFPREKLIERLINRTLILQQAKLQMIGGVKETDVTAQLLTLRKGIPVCKEYHCETDAGWDKFVAAQGFTLPELQMRWRQRMEVLAYIENRFRMGIRITPTEISDYYTKELLPQYAKEKAVAPKLEELSDRIQEILLQQRVSKLLQDWLTSLRAQGTVQILKPGEVAP